MTDLIDKVSIYIQWSGLRVSQQRVICREILATVLAQVHLEQLRSEWDDPNITALVSIVCQMQEYLKETEEEV